ncbi:SHREC complex subunit Mit1, partial [Histoplasma capsulatum]
PQLSIIRRTTIFYLAI